MAYKQKGWSPFTKLDDKKASWTMEYTGNDGNKVTKEEFFKQQQENEKQRRLKKLAEQAKKNK
tara:strand:+ start:6171 stop:6359 length:189 start_codon:yes stop_codon:yes gene_type:complete